MKLHYHTVCCFLACFSQQQHLADRMIVGVGMDKGEK